ncbi:Aste57867_4965 [Aphanomyces stellatus]|uniref:Aste57867_4965 protein n=1 Tax=Aphanomyces stellatus TaxID=120398 RepID=A0A485KEP7_9STRA|nr:hypothetical protein As57867_004952 [Aphanomyces stellatus]VFT82053.1 Aste57867_4965 [Aphanomyces stellatus]
MNPSWLTPTFCACLCLAVVSATHVHARDHTNNQALPCVQVSVAGDATYCLSGGAAICASVDGACPKQGDVAVANCLPTLKSYVANSASCVAPADAECTEMVSGVLGCSFPSAATTVTAPPSPPTASTTPTRPPAPTSSTYSTPLPTPSSSCGADWAQCGGQHKTRTFANCCTNQTFVCAPFNVYYSQCLPKASVASSPPTSVPPARPMTTTSPLPTTSSSCSGDWGQCGGLHRNRTFANCCTNEAFECTAFNAYYSQCLPKSG